jgi:type III pantothenate kinase
MLLCLDVGNSQLFAGVFEGGEILLRFRYSTKHPCTSDQWGVFLRNVLHENGIKTQAISAISMCSVVPSMDYSLISACKKYFSLDPFLLKAGMKTGLKIDYRNPLEVGADRISTAIAAVNLFPDRARIIVDFGTATTYCAVSKESHYLGGVITAGVQLSMEALQSNTAKLPAVQIKAPQCCVGRSTAESLQSGLYYGLLGAIKEITSRIKQERFPDEAPVIIATGGFSRLLEDTKIFNEIHPDLVLFGLYFAAKKNNCYE